MRELPHALAPMGAYKQFIIYKAVPSTTRPGKTDKFPCDFRTGHVVNAHDSSVWTDAATAIAWAAQWGQSYGVGFVFTSADPFWFLDIDDCLEGSDWSALAKGFCAAFNGAAVEVSHSGRGLHIFGTGHMPPHGCKNEPLRLELYHTQRFVALTGVGAIGSAAADFSAVMPAVVAQYFPPSAAQQVDQGWTDGPCDEWRGPTDDAELIRRAMRSQSAAGAFGNRATFADLWTANLAALSLAYPDESRGYNASQADAALAQHLAFWTGRDCQRIDRLMRQSALVRDKWEREDYLVRTILGVAGRQMDVLTDRAPEPPPAPASPEQPTALAETATPKAVEGSTFLSPTEQLQLFAGCVYVSDLHRVLVPGGRLIKPEQFRVHFGGYQLALDHANEKVTRDAWEAFTQSLSWRCPKADRPSFRPELPPAAVVTRGGQSFVNTFWPLNVPRKVGDATPFFTHLAKLLPDERDRHVVLSYMAACVQHAGTKFQWAPIIQGCEGNGKTLLSRCVAEAVGRRYVHWPKASQLGTQFNGWLLGKIFYAVEDIYVHGDKAEVLEALKPMITGEELEIELKGVDQISAEVCGNFMFNSNHRVALPKGENDRRFAFFYTAQQTARDLARDGMTGEYFPQLYDWLRADGYAIVAELLHTMPIPHEYNPATGCPRAPDTSSTAQAILLSRGSIEQELQEAIEQGAPGFAGGFISTTMLDRLLQQHRMANRMPHSKRREMLESMGYRHHPALVDGRVNNIVLPDGNKPRLFVHELSPHRHLASAAEVGRQYEQANNFVGVPFRP